MKVILRFLSFIMLAMMTVLSVSSIASAASVQDSAIRTASVHTKATSADPGGLNKAPVRTVTVVQTPKPQPDPSYKVKSGDTLSAIAYSYYGSASLYPEIASANHIPNPDLIYPDQVLTIPGKTVAVPKTTVVVTPPPVHHSTPLLTHKTAPPVHHSAPVVHAPVQTPHAPSVSSFAGGVNWDKLAMCEATGNWSINNGNGFYGGLQFSESTWLAYGGGAYAHYASDASKSAQISVALKVLAGQGPNAWPASHSRGAACGF